MNSDEIQQLLISLKGMNITDSHVTSALQMIRNDAMTTKGGVKRLIKLACVPTVLKLLYRYVSMDGTETEKERQHSENKIGIAVSIVANLLMEKEARQQVKRDGMETLVTLLTECSNEEAKVRCCRSLGNLAMDSSARQVMAKAKLVPAILKVLEIQYVEVEKPKNPKSSSVDSQKKTFADVNEVDIETRFPSVSLVEAACRVLRYVCGDSKVCLQLLEAGLVTPLSMLVKSEEDRIIACVVRTMSDLWMKLNKRITEKMAIEVSRAGILQKLMELINSEDDRLSHQAFTIFLPLTAHPRSAALIGTYDGVQFLFSHLSSTRSHIIRKDVISGLCQLSKEAVNRVKMRNGGVLKVLIETLEDDALAEVQDRVISCLVNFLYDDASLSILLEERLVDILLIHLQRCGGYTSNMTLNLYKNSVELLENSTSVTETCISSRNGSADNNDLFPIDELSEVGNPTPADTGSVPREKQTGMEVKTDLKPSASKTSRLTISETSFETKVESKISQCCSISETENNQVSFAQNLSAQKHSIEKRNEEDESESKQDTVAEVACHQRYSMNSPTYQAETTWHMEDYNPGVTCKSYKTSWSPDNAIYSSDNGSPHSPYSPLSTLSYYSPSESRQLSPLHSSPVSSPVYCADNMSPVHSVCDSEMAYSPCTSPSFSERSKLECTFTGACSSPVSDCGSFSAASCSHLADQDVLFSSSENEDFADMQHLQREVDNGGDITESATSSVLSFEFTSRVRKVAVVQYHTETSWNPIVGELAMNQDHNQTANGSQDGKVCNTSSHLQSISPKTGDFCSLPLPYQPALSMESVTAEKTSLVLRSVSEQNTFSAETVCTEISYEEKGKNNCALTLNQSSVLSSEIGKTSSDSLKRKFSDEISPIIAAKRLHFEFFKTNEFSEDENSKGKPSAKQPKPNKGYENHAAVTQTNILILLSRLSVSDNFCKHLATPEVISCLTDHLALAKEPHERCVRILSRVLSNPDCLTPLLMMCAPATVVKMLMMDSDFVLVFNSSDPSAQGGLLSSASSQVSQQFPVEETNMKTLMMEKSPKRNLSTETRMRNHSSPSKLSNMDSENNSAQELDSEKNHNSKKMSNNSCRRHPFSKNCHISLAVVGAKLLEDLSNQSVSPYGEGVILHTFLCLPASRQLVFATSLLFLQTHWSREKRQKFLIHRGALAQVLSALCTRHASSSVIKEVIALGLVFMSHNLMLVSRFQPSDLRHLFHKAVEMLNRKPISSQKSAQISDSETGTTTSEQDEREKNLCEFARVEKDLKIVVVNVTSCTVIQARRELLARSSSMFAAMLEGNFVESAQSEVSVRGACPEAMTSIFHFLHGCDEQCLAVKSLEISADVGGRDQVVKRNSHLHHLMNMIALADRFLLPDLAQYLCAVVSISLLDVRCVEEVLRFSVFHGFTGLAEDGMKKLLLSSHPIPHIANCLITLAESPRGSQVAEVIESLMKRGMANTS